MDPTPDQLTACQEKSIKEDSIVIHFYRKISIKITKYVANTPLTPNQISFLALFSALVAAYLFSVNNYAYFILGVFLVQLSIILDCVDGEVARLKHLKSEFGAWFDGMASKTGEIALYFGIAFNYYAQSSVAFLGISFPNSSVFILLSGLIASRLMVISANATLLLIPPVKGDVIHSIYNSPGWLNRLLNTVRIQDYGLLIIEIICIGALLNQFFATMLLLLVMNVVVLLIVTIRLFRKGRRYWS